MKKQTADHEICVGASCGKKAVMFLTLSFGHPSKRGEPFCASCGQYFIEHHKNVAAMALRVTKTECDPRSFAEREESIANARRLRYWDALWRHLLHDEPLNVK